MPSAWSHTPPCFALWRTCGFAWSAARAATESGTLLTSAMGQLRIAVLDTMTGWREVRAFGAEGRMLAAIQAREASLLGAQHGLATRTALAGAGAFLCAQAAL